jgi:hypothetical protein
MNPRDELRLEIRNWLNTWAPNCGASREVFEGQFKALIKQVAVTIDEHEIEAWELSGLVERACR